MTDVDFEYTKGNHRVRIVRDEHAPAPYHDGSFPLLNFTYGHVIHVEQVTEGTSYRLPDSIITAAREFTFPVFERYLRIFHGTTTIKRHDSRSSGLFYAFDTAHWREEMGIEDDQELHAELDEYEAYLEGEVYGLVCERRHLEITGNHYRAAAERLENDKRRTEAPTWRQVSTHAAHLARVAQSYAWTEVADYWGYYGDTSYLHEEAKRLLDEMTKED